LTSGGFRIVSDTLVLFYSIILDLQYRRANLHQIFQKDSKWAAVEKLNFWFLNSFRGGRKVQKGHFFTFFSKSSMVAKRIYLSENRGKISQRTAEIIWCIVPISDSGLLLKY